MVVRELLIGLGFNLDHSKIKQADQGIEKLKSSAQSAAGAFGQIAAIIGVAFGAREIVKAADEWTNMYSRIGLVTKNTEEQAAMQEKVFAIAQKTRQEYSSTADLYVKMARNSKELGATQQDVLDATETVNKALVIGGASTTEAKSTILQLGQALASGRLAGDELRSLSENAPLLFQAIADYYGVTIGKLKDMGAQGELTAEGVFKAILKAKSKMDKEFSKMPVTIEQSVTYALNRIGKLIFNLNKETSVFQAIAGGIVRAADWIADKFEWAAKKVGGFGNMLKMAAIAVLSFAAAMFIVKEGLFTLELWSIGFQILGKNIVAAAKAMGLFLIKIAPILLIAAAIALVALALEDVYTWITGGESVIGDWLGSWDEFRAKNAQYIDPLIDGFRRLASAIQTDVIPTIALIWNAVVQLANAIKNVVVPLVQWILKELSELTDGGSVILNILLTAWRGIVNAILMALKFWRQIFEGDFSGAIDTVAGYFKNLLDTVLSILRQIGAAIGNYVLDKLAQAKSSLLGFLGITGGGGQTPTGGPSGGNVGGVNLVQAPGGVTPAALATQTTAPGPVAQTVNQTVNIEQNNAGANLQPTEIAGATAGATTDALAKMTRNLQFGD